MKVLSFDQSSVKTGYAVFVDGVLSDYGIIDVSKEKDLSIRFSSMCLKIIDLMTILSPTEVVFEDVSLQTNASTLTVLARLQGALMLASVLHTTPFMVYKPSAWRKKLGFTQGRGVARKDLKAQAIAYVKEHYGTTVKEDISEAICIGAAYLSEQINK